jgi:DNA-binding HxlR family transcriptional regulator
MSRFTYQNSKRKESEQRIINALTDGDKSFTTLLQLTGISKPVLSQRLDSLEEQGKIKSGVPEPKTKRFLYHLETEKLDDIEKANVSLHNYSMITLDCLEEFAKDPNMPDEEYWEWLGKGITALMTFKMYELMMSTGPETQEYLKTIIGPEFAKRSKDLFPENRNLENALKTMLPTDQAVFGSKDAEQAATQLLEHLKKIQRS